MLIPSPIDRRDRREEVRRMSGTSAENLSTWSCRYPGTRRAYVSNVTLGFRVPEDARHRVQVGAAGEEQGRRRVTSVVQPLRASPRVFSVARPSPVRSVMERATSGRKY